MEIKKTVHQEVTEEEVEEAEEQQYEFTFQKIDHQKAEAFAKDPSIVPEGQQVSRRRQVEEAEGYTFEKVDQEKAKDWAQDGAIITETKKPEPVDLLLPSDDEPSYARADQEMEEEWEKSGIVSTPKKVTPKGFFDESSGGEDLLLPAEEGPSYVKADQAMEDEWKQSGLIVPPKKASPRGFFEQPTPAEKGGELLESPTFLQIKDQEASRPKKLMIADLLKPKSEPIATNLPKKSKLPTFLQMNGQDLSEEQLRAIQEVEEEERKRKEKEEELL